MPTITEEQIRSVKEVFIGLVIQDTDWSYAADQFILWCLEEDFKNKSFANFVEWVYGDAQGEPMKGIWTEAEDDSESVLNPKTWDFFFGYGDNFERFANDWVDEEEREEYLQFANR